MRLAVTTAATLSLVMVAVMAAIYVAAASVLFRQAGARLTATLRARTSFVAPGVASLGRDEDEAPEHDEEDDPAEDAHGDRRASHPLQLLRGDRAAPAGNWTWLWPQPGDALAALESRVSPRVVAQMSLHEMAETLAGMRRWLVFIGAAGTLIVSTVAFASARRAFVPVEEMIRAAVELASTTRIDARALEVQVPAAAGDVTLRRLAEAFNTMLRRLKGAFESQQRLVDDASHELRTPLGALVADLEVALATATDAREYRSALDRALIQARRLTRLSNQLLALARYEEGEGLAIRSDCPVAEAADQAVADVRHVAEAAGVMLVTEVPPGLCAHMDPLAIGRVLSNLLCNAVDASPPGATVTLVAREAPGWVVLEVVDTGRGMEPGEARRAFEPFYRGRARGEGAGLGLSIVRAIVRAHGGTVALDTAPGKGTTARVRIPRHPPQARISGGARRALPPARRAGGPAPGSPPGPSGS